jgi:hypothetical protein
MIQPGRKIIVGARDIGIREKAHTAGHCAGPPTLLVGNSDGQVQPRKGIRCVQPDCVAAKCMPWEKERAVNAPLRTQRNR